MYRKLKLVQNLNELKYATCKALHEELFVLNLYVILYPMAFCELVFALYSKTRNFQKWRNEILKKVTPRKIYCSQNIWRRGKTYPKMKSEYKFNGISNPKFLWQYWFFSKHFCLQPFFFKILFQYCLRSSIAPWGGPMVDTEGKNFEI